VITTKVYCLGDGYAHGHIWPEWPQLLQCLFPTFDVICLSGIGAGNEFLISQLLEHDIEQSTVIFQWAQPNRFDKLIEDKSWDTTIGQDSVYNENIIDNWWLSSASTSKDIQTYHNFFVQPEQAKLRYRVQKQLVESYLRDKRCTYVCTSTEEQEKFAKQSRFAKVRQQEVQPSPIVHLNFLIEIILPQLNIVPDQKILNYITDAVQDRTWIAYDPDREEILDDITKYFNSH
jgi:hypothetical protein